MPDRLDRLRWLRTRQVVLTQVAYEPKRSTEAGQHLAFVELEATLLIGSDLVHVNLGEAGSCEPSYRSDMCVDVGTADNVADDGVGRHLLDDLFEVVRTRKVNEGRALDRGVGPPLRLVQ